MNEVIKISGIEVYAHHGVFAEEKRDGQTFYLDIELALRANPARDDLADTTDYGAVAECAHGYAERNAFDLIETLADGAARHILDSFAGVKRVAVTVHKPHAPIPVPFADVTVTARREWTDCCLGLGSNLGDKRAYLDGAVASLRARTDVRGLRVAEYLATPPYGVTDQDDFLNTCVRFDTYLTPRELLALCGELESAAHRERKRRWGERTLDVDILLCGRVVVSDPDLCVPHIEMHKRAFVLTPLAEIAAECVHPLLGKTVAMLKEELT